MGAYKAATGNGECYMERVKAEHNCRGKATYDSTFGRFTALVPDKYLTQAKTPEVNTTISTSENNTTGKESSSSYWSYTIYDSNGTITRHENCDD